MLETCARLCRDLKVQFLDETVTLAQIRLGRSDAGWPQFTRVYLFEFSGTGQDRWQGRATLAGQRVLSVQFEHPGRRHHPRCRCARSRPRRCQPHPCGRARGRTDPALSIFWTRLSRPSGSSNIARSLRPCRLRAALSNRYIGVQ